MITHIDMITHVDMTNTTAAEALAAVTKTIAPSADIRWSLDFLGWLPEGTNARWSDGERGFGQPSLVEMLGELPGAFLVNVRTSAV